MITRVGGTIGLINRFISLRNKIKYLRRELNMQQLRKKVLPIILFACFCLSCGTPVCAESEKSSTEMASRIKDNPIVDLVCNEIANYRKDYYDITSISGKVSNIEKAPNGVNIIVDVNYSTKIKARTPDDSPYIKGIKAAIDRLTNKKDIERANSYLKIWYGELERDHIGKSLPHSSEFKVFIPVSDTRNALDINAADFLDKVPLTNAQVMYRQYDFVNSNAVRTANSGVNDHGTYEDKTMDAFALPNDKEVMNNAYQAVQDIVGSSNVATGSSRAQELDRVAARDYASDSNNFPHNSQFNYYDGHDCANFVSQCYYMGGLSEDNTWKRYSNPWINTGGSRSGGIYGLSNYMQDNGIVFWVNGSNITRAFAGSIIYYQSGTPGGHVGIVTSNDGREMRYSAHTNDHCNETMNQTWFSAHCDFLIPCWDSYTGTWTPQ